MTFLICSFLQLPVSSAVSVPNILLSTLIWHPPTCSFISNYTCLESHPFNNDHKSTTAMRKQILTDSVTECGLDLFGSEGRNKCQAYILVQTVMNLRIPSKARNFLATLQASCRNPPRKETPRRYKHKWNDNINKKLLEELFAYIPLIRHGPHRKGQVHKFYCCMYVLPQERAYRAVAY
jgi:hypothetical protein